MALSKLEEALTEHKNDLLMIDGTIHRFELAINLYWKTLKRCLQSEGIEAKTPRETLKKAFKAEWLNDEEAWLQMLKDRNETSHTYNEDLAREILSNIHSYFPEMKAVFKFLKSKFQEG